MIKKNIIENQPKAVGLLSGGLDSTLAAKIIKDLGFDVYGVYFAMPWGCCDKQKAFEAAEQIGIKMITLQLDERYLGVIKSPRFGRGTALNPCVDCRIHMFSRAAQYMRHIGAEFIFTGEVVGQRPMSQKKERLKIIEREIGCEGRLVRPLCAQLLEPTIPEREGLIDRHKLLRLSGRSRKSQYDLADKLNVSKFNQPAGGCLLTDQNFARRMKDTLKYGTRNFRETVALKWGRHYRIYDDFKVIVGRDKEENESLKNYAHPDDIIMELPKTNGPTVIIKGKNPSSDVLSKSAYFIQRYSKYKDKEPVTVNYWMKRNPNDVQQITAQMMSDKTLEVYQI